MSLQSCLLCETVLLQPHDTILVLNSAEDPFVPFAAQKIHAVTITLAEDNVAALQTALHALNLDPTATHIQHQRSTANIKHVAFHDYIVQQPADVDPDIYSLAVMNLLYQPARSWVLYGLRLAMASLRPGGSLYITGAKERGIQTIASYMQALFGNSETLLISKGQRVIRSRKLEPTVPPSSPTHLEQLKRLSEIGDDLSFQVFATNQLDEGTRLLLDALQVHPNDIALDLGCGAGFIGLHIAQQAPEGHVTMLDASLAAVAASQHAINERHLHNIHVLPSDSARAVINQRFSLVASNPPFHHGGIQTTSIAERFIQDATTVLEPDGRFYLVANRFLKYEPICSTAFKHVREIAGNTRYKVLLIQGSRNK